MWFVVPWLPNIVQCTSYNVRRVLYAVHFTSRIVRRTVYGVYCTLVERTANYIRNVTSKVHVLAYALYIVPSTSYIIRRTCNVVNCTWYLAYSTPYTGLQSGLHSTTYSVHGTLYIVYCIRYIYIYTYSLFYIVRRKKCIVWSLYICTAYVVLCKLYFVQSTAYSLLCTLYAVAINPITIH